MQSGFKADQKRKFGRARYGWNMMGGKLVGLLARFLKSSRLVAHSPLGSGPVSLVTNARR